MTSRMRLTDKEPTFLPADSKAILVKVQQKAVASAASSPMWVLKYVFILFQLLACKENHFGAQKNDLSAFIGCQVVSLRRSVFQSTQLSGLLAGARPSAAAFLLAARFAGAVTAAGTATFFLLRVSIVNKNFAFFGFILISHGYRY